jgi:hypothetical protein
MAEHRIGCVGLVQLAPTGAHAAVGIATLVDTDQLGVDVRQRLAVIGVRAVRRASARGMSSPGWSDHGLRHAGRTFISDLELRSQLHDSLGRNPEIGGRGKAAGRQ